MRVAIVPDPVLYEREGGLRVQVGETLAALARLGSADGAGMVARLATPCLSTLDGCDLLHVFGAAGAGERLLEAAQQRGVPMLLSARVSPGWSRSNGVRARVADRVLGNRSGWDADSAYARIRRALRLSSLVVALGEAERKAICDGFLVAADKVRVIPNGVGARFFEADPGLFRARTRIAGRFALMVGEVSPYHNQLGIARLLAGLALPMVAIGAARERDAGYMRELRALRTVTCLGPLGHDDALLASAYAASSVLVLAGQGAALPMAALEALAAGTPVVGTVPAVLPPAAAVNAYRQVGWNDSAALAQALSGVLAEPPPRDAVRALARGFGWDSVAAQLAQCYRELAAAR